MFQSPFASLTIAILMSVPTLGWAALPTGEEVLQAWKAREARFKTARIAWTEKHHFERGSDIGIDARESTPDGKVFPNEAIDFESTVTAVFDGDKYAVFRSGKQWHNQAEAVIPMIHKYASDGTSFTRVWQFGEATPERHHVANISQKRKSPILFQDIVYFPMGIWCRPSPLVFVSEECVPAAPQASSVAGRPCARIVWTHPQLGQYWYDADPEADCLPRHFHFGLRQMIDIEYERRDGEWFPVRWTRNMLGHDRKTVVQTARAEVTKCEVNIPIGPSELDPEMPVGALVRDTRARPSEVHLVTSSGKRPVTPEELKRGATYSELASTPSGEAALPVSRNSWQWWHWAALAAAIVAIPIVFRLLRSHR